MKKNTIILVLIQIFIKI